MTWAAELKRIRYYLRDPEQKIWSDSLLKNLFNQAQNELQQRTHILENVSNLRIPPEYSGSYVHDWEFAFLDTNRYRALRNHGNNFSFCFRWEVQEHYGIESDTADEGCNYTQPFEAFLSLLPGTPPAIPFPANLHSVKNMYHDEMPITEESKKSISSHDPSWVTRSGYVISYYIDDQSSNQFYLYGRPSVTWTDTSGTGMVTSVEGDTTSEVGTVTQRTGSILTEESGVAVDVIDDPDNLTLVYDISPQDVTGLGDETDYPAYLLKYIRYRVLEFAYGANTDGRIVSLADYWRTRARMGVDFVKQFNHNRSKDRDYQLSGGTNRRTNRMPRLPDAYPPVFP